MHLLTNYICHSPRYLFGACLGIYTTGHNVERSPSAEASTLNESSTAEMWFKWMEDKVTITDRTDNSLSQYQTLGNNESKNKKIKSVESSRLYYQNAEGTIVDSNLVRAKTPTEIKSFFSWLIKKSDYEINPCLFNLSTLYPQPEDKYIPYFDATSRYKLQTKMTFEGKKTGDYIRVTKVKQIAGEVIDNYTLNVEKYVAQKNGQNKLVASNSFSVINPASWKKGGVIPLNELDMLVDEAIKYRNYNYHLLIHCVDGKERTGTFVTAIILKEAIKGELNIIGINKENYKTTICNLIVSLRSHGGGSGFVGNADQLQLLFSYAEELL